MLNDIQSIVGTIRKRKGYAWPGDVVGDVVDNRPDVILSFSTCRAAPSHGTCHTHPQPHTEGKKTSAVDVCDRSSPIMIETKSSPFLSFVSILIGEDSMGRRVHR